MFFFFLQCAILLAYHQKHYEIPLPQVEITFICFAYNILHNIKQIYTILHLLLHKV